MPIEIEFKKAVSATNEVDQNLIQSNKIIDALKEKTKEHNSTIASKVNFFQLKSLFLSGASNKKEGFTSNESGWARINMYIRTLGQVEEMAHAAHKEAKKNTKMVLDFSSLIQPIEIDFAQAKEDMKKYGVEFDFGDVSDLYLAEKAALTSYFKKYL